MPVDMQCVAGLTLHDRWQRAFKTMVGADSASERAQPAVH